MIEPLMEIDQQDVPSSENYGAIVAEIVSAYVSNNSVPPLELPDLIASVHGAIMRIQSGAQAEPEPTKLTGAVSIKKSIGEDYLISMIDGKKYQALRRHIGGHGMTPDQYRDAYGLPPSYPMVAPAYSARRSKLAKDLGLGRKAAEETVTAEPRSRKQAA